VYVLDVISHTTGNTTLYHLRMHPICSTLRFYQSNATEPIQEPSVTCDLTKTLRSSSFWLQYSKRSSDAL